MFYFVRHGILHTFSVVSKFFSFLVRSSAFESAMGSSYSMKLDFEWNKIWNDLQVRDVQNDAELEQDLTKTLWVRIQINICKSDELNVFDMINHFDAYILKLQL